jgi:hypothetical protein
VKPAFWQDPETGRWPADIQTLYMRLWAVADDVGWLEWDPDVIGALTYPYRPAASRVRHIRRHATFLAEQRRLVLYDCGCVHLPKLEAHQRIAGTKSIWAYSRHAKDHKNPEVAPNNYLSAPRSIFTHRNRGYGVGSREGEGLGEGLGNGRASARDEKDTFPPIGSRQ